MRCSQAAAANTKVSIDFINQSEGAENLADSSTICLTERRLKGVIVLPYQDLSTDIHIKSSKRSVATAARLK